MSSAAHLRVGVKSSLKLFELVGIAEQKHRASNACGDHQVGPSGLRSGDVRGSLPLGESNSHISTEMDEPQIGRIRQKTPRGRKMCRGAKVVVSQTSALVESSSFVSLLRPRCHSPGCSKARCTCGYWLHRFFHRNIESHILFVLDYGEGLGIVTAPQIKRLVLRAVDMDHCARF